MPHLGYAVNRKACGLIEAYEQVEQQRKNHAVNNGPGDQVLWTVGDQPAEEIILELAMRFFNGTLKLNAPPFDLEKHLRFLLMQRHAYLMLKCCDLMQQTANTIVNEAPIRLPGH